MNSNKLRYSFKSACPSVYSVNVESGQSSVGLFRGSRWHHKVGGCTSMASGQIRSRPRTEAFTSLCPSSWYSLVTLLAGSPPFPCASYLYWSPAYLPALEFRSVPFLPVVQPLSSLTPPGSPQQKVFSPCRFPFLPLHRSFPHKLLRCRILNYMAFKHAGWLCG